jgi:hypothetical protein
MGGALGPADGPALDPAIKLALGAALGSADGASLGADVGPADGPALGEAVCATADDDAWGWYVNAGDGLRLAQAPSMKVAPARKTTRRRWRVSGSKKLSSIKAVDGRPRLPDCLTFGTLATGEDLADLPSQLHTLGR